MSNEDLGMYVEEYVEEQAKKPKKEFVNNSGKGNGYPVPRVIKDHFNWGAFLLSWIWGLGNKTYITLLIFPALIIPFVNMIAWIAVPIWFGIKGNEWAWQNKRFNGVHEFHEYQKKWTMWGIIAHIVLFVASIIIWLSSMVMMFSALVGKY